MTLTYTGEVFGNLSGGLEIGCSCEDLIRFEADPDLGKLLGWTGDVVHVSVDRIDNGGRDAEDLVGALSDPSNIDARPTTRLFTLWVQQQLGDAGSARVGQIAADDEFLVSSTASELINNTFAWANIVDINLPAGGPAFPLAHTGRASGAYSVGERHGFWPPSSAAIWLAPAAPDENPQVCNKHGTTFSFTGGALFMGEVQYRPRPSSPNVAVQSAYKLGGFYLTV